ncbi:MAG TPA: cytochrome P450 [Acidimicrobiia bacterium]|nr:cytochrome P450 [Acidimicrobiia bacterium]
MVEFNPYLWETAHNPYPIYKQLRDEAPVYRNDELGFWALSRHADVAAAHNDPARFVSSGGVTIEGYEKDSPFLIVKDPPEHTWHRKIVGRVFTPRRIADLEPFIRDRCAALLDPFRDAGEFDAVADFSVQLPLSVISELLGIPEEYRAAIHDLSNQVLSRENLDDPKQAEAVQNASVELMQLYLGLVQDRRRRPRDDVISLLIETAVTDDDGGTRTLDDEEIAYRFLELGAAGHETVAKLIPSGVIALAWYPDQRRELVADPSLMKGAVEEMLRWEPPSQLQGRTTACEVELHGVTIPAGVRVMLITGSATHDERVYEEPELFDIHRVVQHPVTFGFGIHVCLGAHLARLEVRVAFEELLARFPDFDIDGTRAVRHVLTNVRGLSNLPLVVGVAA